MSRTIKLAILASFAALAVGAVSASGAQAAIQQFHCTATKDANCNITGTSPKGKFEVGGVTTTCTATYAATIPKTGTTALITPTYTGCKTSGLASTVNVNGCTYDFNSTGEVEATAKVNILCPIVGGVQKKIEVIANSLPCTYFVGPQNNLEHVVFTNSLSAEPTDVTAKATVSKIAVTNDGRSGCTSGPGSLSDEVTLTAKEATTGTAVGLHVF